TSEWWQADIPSLEDPGSPSLRSLAAWTTAAILGQLVLGAAFRHGAFGIWPHLVGAGVVLVMAILTGRAARKRFARIPAIRRSVIWLLATVGTQILLGGAAYWAIVASRDAVQPGLTYVFLSVAHVLVGALTLVASVLLTLVCRRLIRPAESTVVSHAPSEV